MKHRVAIGLVIALLCATLFPLLAHAESTLDRIKRQGSVAVGITNDYPLAFKQPDGSIAGSDYEIASKVFASLGVKVEPVILTWGGLIPALKAGRIDVAAAGMFIRPERCLQVAFSNPDYQAIDTLVVAKGNPKNLHSFADVVTHATVNIAAAQGGAALLSAKRADIPATQIQLFPSSVEMLAALTAGRVDAVAIDTVLASKLVSLNKDEVERAEPFHVQMVDGRLMRSFGAFVFRPADTDLVGAFNTFLGSYIGSAEQVALLEKYGMTKEEIPPPGTTAADICKQ